MPSTDYKPEVADVGALMRARTKTDSGSEPGTFNADTRPTGDEVETQIIPRALSHVAARIGDDVPDAEELRDQVKNLVALRAAMLIELSYLPEQARGDNSAYKNLKDLYDEELVLVAKAVKEYNEGGDPGAEGESDLPSYDFPADAGGMVGWATRW